MILVDSSVWISFFARRPSNRAAELRLLILNGTDVAATPNIVQEVLQGTRSEAELTAVRERLSTVHLLSPLDEFDTYVEAARIYARCRWGGVTIRSSADCLIACIAVEHDVPLFHDDRDFDHLASFVPALRLA